MDISAISKKGGSKGKSKDKDKEKCRACGKIGHLTKDCWFAALLDKGEGKGKDKVKSTKGGGDKGKSKPKGACHYYSKDGHYTRECLKKKEDEKRKSQAELVVAETPSRVLSCVGCL